MKTKLIFLFMLSMILIMCNSESDQSENFNIKKLRQDLIDLIEKPATNELIDNIKVLKNTIDTFSNEISNSNLKSLRKAWKKAAEAFSVIEPFNFGKVKDVNILKAIYNWGADDISINEYINSNKIINEETINILPTTQRGLSAVEYLIFELTEDETLQSFSNTRKIDYLTALGNNLVSKSNTYKSLWENNRIDFINNDREGINGSINQIINQIHALLEDIKSLKIGEPTSIEKTIIPNEELLQAEKSSFSLEIIAKNIESIKQIYFGKENGLDDYIFAESKHNDLNTRAEQIFNNIATSIKKLEEFPLNVAITLEPEKVKKLYENIKSLLLLMKIDVANTLSVTITVTDNDGD